MLKFSGSRLSASLALVIDKVLTGTASANFTMAHDGASTDGMPLLSSHLVLGSPSKALPTASPSPIAPRAVITAVAMRSAVVYSRTGPPALISATSGNFRSISFVASRPSSVITGCSAQAANTFSRSAVAASKSPAAALLTKAALAVKLACRFSPGAKSAKAAFNNDSSLVLLLAVSRFAADSALTKASVNRFRLLASTPKIRSNNELYSSCAGARLSKALIDRPCVIAWVNKPVASVLSALA